ncbi:MAG: hypothetical protein R6U66_02825 [Bacteroidales bacterium]
MRKREILWVLIFLMLLGACKQKNTFERDLDEQEVSIDIERLDQIIFEGADNNLEAHVASLLQHHAEFMELYSHKIIRIGSPYHADYVNRLTKFLQHETVLKAKEEVDETFSALNEEEALLSTAFSYYKYYFPERAVPRVYSYVGGFNESIVLADSLLGIGLDKYLGSDCEYYGQLGFPAYMQQNMKPDMIPYDAIRGWVSSEFVFNDSVDNVLSHMVYQGMMQYAMDAFLPYGQEPLKYGFTPQELKWCQNNQRAMWDYLVEHELLFSTRHMVIAKYIEPAPFTPGFPEEAPGRAIIYLGRQIVGAFMDKNADVTLPMLMAMDDYTKIFQDARYKP